MNGLADYYETIFKRKSFHLFRGVSDEQIAPEELNAIERAFEGFEPLYSDIRTAVRIVPAQKVNFKRDAEYCVLIYSEKKENYLMNAGFLGEQLDLWLVKHGIGSLWYGIGKPDESTFQGMHYVIMFAIHKVTDNDKFRKDMYKAKRKPLNETWSGTDIGIADIVRFAPSACNSQPWYVESKSGEITVYRYQKPGRIGLLTAHTASYFNRIDIGIYLCFMEICMAKNGIVYTRTLYPDDGANRELTKSAVYRLAQQDAAAAK